MYNKTLLEKEINPFHVTKKVIKLRKQLEAKNYKVSREEINELTRLHIHLYECYWRAVFNDYYNYEGEVEYFHEQISKNYERVVIGAHGPYVEIKPEDITCELITKPGEEWRTLPNYNRVKYEYLILDNKESPELKVYKQKRTVNYADYKPGFLYVDRYQVDFY